MKKYMMTMMALTAANMRSASVDMVLIGSCMLGMRSVMRRISLAIKNDPMIIRNSIGTRMIQNMSSEVFKEVEGKKVEGGSNQYGNYTECIVIL